MAVHAGKVYALGGFDGLQRLASVEAYDPFHNRWTKVNIEFNIYVVVLLLKTKMFTTVATMNMYNNNYNLWKVLLIQTTG